MMRGLAFLALLAAAAASAQTGTMYRIAMLETTSETANRANLEAFRKGMRELGYAERRDYLIDYRSADGRADRYGDLAAELVRAKPDVIVTRGYAAARAALSAGSIPVVMASSADPIASGVVKSLTQPGGNITGLSAMYSELAGTRLELLKELAPQTNHVAVLLNLTTPMADAERREVERAASALKIETTILDVRNAEGLPRALEAVAQRKVDALSVNAEAVMMANRETILDFARKHRLPVMYAAREYVEGGGLIAYGVSYPHLYQRAASYVDRILKGARPGDLPIGKPTKFDLAINVRAATALGIPIPSQLLLRADELVR